MTGQAGIHRQKQMSSTNIQKYVQFPLFLLRELLTDKEETIRRIFAFGIVHFSQKFSFDLREVARQLMYGYYRDRDKLPTNLREELDSHVRSERLTLDEDYNGFKPDDTFSPDEEIGQLIPLFEECTVFKAKAIQYYKLHMALKSLNITPGNSIIERAALVSNTMSESETMGMVKVSLLFDVRDNEKSEFELMQFAAYVAVKSIIGRKEYCKTNKAHILSRMFGYSSIKEVPDKFESGILNDLFKKYNHRYHMDRIIQALEAKWGLVSYSRHTRGLYIAMEKKTSLNDLASAAEKRKEKNKIAELKLRKREATRKALEQIKKEQQAYSGTT